MSTKKDTSGARTNPAKEKAARRANIGSSTHAMPNAGARPKTKTK